MCSWIARSALRWILIALLLLALNTQGRAQTPQGDFMCRRFVSGGADAGWILANVAVMHLNDDGTYRAKDLTTSIPEVHGRFTYDAKTKTLVWDSGIWTTLLGHYLPNLSGTAVLMITTKKDAEGTVDGALQCIRISPK
jgi:hypothetical protein